MLRLILAMEGDTEQVAELVPSVPSHPAVVPSGLLADLLRGTDKDV